MNDFFFVFNIIGLSCIWIKYFKNGEGNNKRNRKKEEEII